ncbi:MAG: YceI family protein [Deltaproteobacteria bacterium]|jgi:polyisoprenoid-binding protein YceI|nr:YceI family protein [Deltaproteobacteria bacterium]
MQKILITLIAIISVVLCAHFASAELEKWEIDKAHSNIYFDVRHTYATVRGLFEDYSGSVQFDADNMEMGKISLEVRTKSVNTGIPNRDNHLRADEFFGVNEYPTMTFESTGVKQKEGNRYMVEGNLTIKGKTEKVAVPFTYFGSRENPLKKGQQVAGFEARFSINRLDYGVGPGKYAEMGTIANQVDILVSLEVVK